MFRLVAEFLLHFKPVDFECEARVELDQTLVF